jgi:hypothetical protein
MLQPGLLHPGYMEINNVLPQHGRISGRFSSKEYKDLVKFYEQGYKAQEAGVFL